MKKQQYVFHLLFKVILIFVITGCTSFPPCISPQEEGLMISWGELITETGEINGWSFDSKSMLYTYKKNRTGDITREKITRIPKDKYCSLLSQIKQNILQTQALNAPGELSRFVEYSNSSSNVFIRALWNAKYETVGSKGFRHLYDSLVSITREFGQ